jgi:hypothetical protein
MPEEPGFHDTYWEVFQHLDSTSSTIEDTWTPQAGEVFYDAIEDMAPDYSMVSC